MLTAIINLFSGGFLGVIGGIFQKWLEQSNSLALAKVNLDLVIENNKQAILMASANKELMAMEAQNALAIAGLNASTELEKTSYDAMKASYESDKIQASADVQSKHDRLYAYLDALRCSIRPILTYVLNFLVFIIFCTSAYFYWAGATGTPIADLKTASLEILTQTVKTTLFLAELATGYWFAARPMIRD